jgi:type I restriction enzyme S subunit
MNPMQLVHYFDCVTEAPDAIPHLRQFVLELAVRGKLVDRNPKDEPASALLHRVQAEKDRRVREGQMKKYECLPEVRPDETWFDIPVSWHWVRLGTITQVLMGQSPPGESYNKTGEGIPLINGPVEFTAGPFGKTIINQYTTAPTNLCEEGDLLLCVRGSTTGRTNIAGFRACIGRGVAAIRPFFADRYVRLFIWRQRASIIAMGRGIAFPSVSRQQIEELPVPLPPLAEQHRIVAKVDELMALCDQLENTQRERESRRDRLALASHHHLNNGADAEAFRKYAHFYLDHFPRITTAPVHIQHLRETIRRLAVVGKLTDNQWKDRTANDELRDVETRKREMALRKPKPITPISDKEKWCELPTAWTWARWDQITDWITYGFTRPMPHTSEGIPIVTGKNINLGRIIFETAHRTTEQAFAELNEKDRPIPGDLLLTKDGSIGRSAIVDTEEPFCINQSVAVLWLRSCHFDRRFLQLAIDCPQTQQEVVAKTEGVAIRHISVVDFGKMVFPLPPLAEQHRIVAKVDELMALCDRLEDRLTSGQTESIRLLHSVLHHALVSPEYTRFRAEYAKEAVS